MGVGIRDSKEHERASELQKSPGLGQVTRGVQFCENAFVVHFYMCILCFNKKEEEGRGGEDRPSHTKVCRLGGPDRLSVEMPFPGGDTDTSHYPNLEEEQREGHESLARAQLSQRVRWPQG